MRVLGIETTCDETAAAVVATDETGRGVILSNEILSQIAEHAPYGGVVPEIAARAHVEVLDVLVKRALAAAGPGLIGGVIVGLTTGKSLAMVAGKPLIAVNHLEAHALSPRLTDGIAFPYLLLLVSGGHTQLLAVRGVGDYVRLGTTIDDAIGEAYDKAAAILGLPYPGGPIVDRLAQPGNDRAVEFPISRLSKDSLDFSFSGLKTAVLYTVHGVPTRDGPAPSIMSAPPQLGPKRVADICASFQRATVAAVILKLTRALDAHPDARVLLVGGGVSANSRLRTELAALASKRGVSLSIPDMAYCLDNAAMIAGFGHALLECRGWVGDDLTLAAAASTFL